MTQMEDARARTLTLIKGLDEAQLMGPRLPTVNPLRWEIAHAAYFYEYWILRGHLGEGAGLPDVDRLFDSIHIAHDTRWDLPLPSLPETLAYMDGVLDRVRRHLEREGPDPQRDYLLQYAIFHEDMHTEAYTYTRQTLAYPAPEIGRRSDLAAAGDSAPGDVEIPGGMFPLGAQPGDGFVFDNEKWAHPVEVQPFRIARTAVSNAGFAEFVEDRGYQRESLWDPEGWVWRQASGLEQPRYWRRGSEGWECRRFDRWEPLLPEAVVPATLRLEVREPDGSLLGPFTISRPAAGPFRVVVSEGRPLATGSYAFQFVVADAAGRPLIEETRPWELEAEPWRGSPAGLIDTPPPPWTPLQTSGREIATRMTRYQIGADGLPAQIWAAGTPLLTGPVQLLEDAAAVAGTTAGLGPATANEVAWEASFPLSAGVARLRCRTEFDGMTRFELTLPGGNLGRVAIEIPLAAQRASRLLTYRMGARGVSTASVAAADGVVLDSRPTGKAAGAGYGFFGHVDLNDRDRGLFWFCDNAAGWKQSPQQAAIEVVRRGDTVALVLNVVAEAGPYEATRPIVFGILPHPARPLPKEYRLYERVAPAENPRACDIFDAFYPWPMDPRAGSAMALYPGPDPGRPEAGPSWDYAESCGPIMRSCKPAGLVTFYLSRYWFSCRAGNYDHWEWRSGEGGSVSLTPAFVDYACWEMDQWIGRGIWDAIYLDECYESPCRNLEAGFSVRLPDGSEQPGVRNFDFRELMKRWRCIFTAHGREPVIMAHHTYSWQYPGLVFADAVLDGENAPIVSLSSRDWIDSTSQERFECLQNARLWGMATFYMPFIAEGGFANKEKSQFPAWQWRMARQAQSRFAHGETATVYEGQGAAVYDGYWRDLLAWGVGDPASCSFHPPWESGRYLQVAGDAGRALVSLYRRPQAAVVIASNPTSEPIDLVVELDTAALGLPAAPAARSLDATFSPPPGADFRGMAVVKQAAAEQLTKALTDPLAGQEDADPLLAIDDEELLEGGDAVAAKEAARWEPRIDGPRLRIPIRPRDYRVIALE
jgi:hypothetical protein